MSGNIATGENIQLMCDIFIGIDEYFKWNPEIHACEPSRKLSLPALAQICSTGTKFNNPRMIFIYGPCLPAAAPLLVSACTNPFVLVSHNSDYNLDDSVVCSAWFMELMAYPLLHAFHAQNMCMRHPRQYFPKLRPLPIGIANRQWSHGRVANFAPFLAAQPKIRARVYFQFSIGTNRTVREACRREIAATCFTPWREATDYNTYLTELAQCEFAICPEGNGADTHRIWECMHLRVIPIVKQSPFTDVLLHRFKLPLVILDEWSNFSTDHVTNYATIVGNMDNGSAFGAEWLTMTAIEQKLKQP
jgi:hypothetical protein